MTDELPPTGDERRDALAGRLFGAALGAFDLLTIHLGLELGLYETLRPGPLTPGCARAERYERPGSSSVRPKSPLGRPTAA